MPRWTAFTFRAVFIVGFLIVLPVMAMPSVAGYLDRLLYGNAESSVPPMTEPVSTPAPKVQPQADVSRATLELPLSDESAPFGNSERFQSPPPPQLQRAPAFLSHAKSIDAIQLTPDVSPLDEATARKIDAVRSRLEELGAEYVRLEMSENGSTFHCHCEMLLEDDTGQTQPFEAIRSDPVAAAEAMLANVEAWRNADRSAD